MKISNGLLAKLKEELQQGKLENTIDTLNKITTQKQLIQIREQKLLIKVQGVEHQSMLVISYKNAVDRVIVDESERDRERKYADFTQIVHSALISLTNDKTDIVLALKFLHPVELLNLSAQVALQFETDIRTRLESSLLNQVEALQDIEKADLGEFYIHELNGNYNEIMFAMARAINEILPLTNPRKAWGSGNRIINKAKGNLEKAIQIANYWNGIEYALDCVTYGEWFIMEITTDPVQVVLGIRDIALQRARTIGIRRTLISKRYYRSRSKKYIQDILRSFAQEVTDTFIETFTNKYGLLRRSQFEEVHKHIASYVDLLEAEDDFLLAAAGKIDDITILGLYMASLTIRCYTTVVYHFKKVVSRRHARELVVPELPIDKIIDTANSHIKANMPSDLDLKEAITKGVRNQILSLPVLRFLTLQSRPYFKISDNKVYSLKEMEDSNWSTHIRTEVVRGNKISDAFGEIIEEYLVFLFAEHRWIVLGKGINIKRTDIDLLVYKDGLILAIQVKGIARGGYNMYEHWKSRETIIKGAEQAKIAEEVLYERPNLIAHLMASKKLNTEVKRVQPVVITNSPLFTGWNCNGVPVVGIGSLTGIFNGAKARFTNARHEVMSTKNFIAGDEPTMEEYLDLLHNPFEWRIARDDSTVEHQLVSTPYINIAYPFLKRSQELL